MYSTVDPSTAAATPAFTPPAPQAVPTPQQPLQPISTPATKAKALKDVLANLAQGKNPVGTPDQTPSVGKPPQPGSQTAQHVDNQNNPFAPGGEYYGVDPNLVGQSHQQKQAVDQASQDFSKAGNFDPGEAPKYAAPVEEHVGRKNTLAAILGGLALLAGPGYKGGGMGSLLMNLDKGMQEGREKAMTRKDAQAKEKFEADSENYKNKVDLDKFRSSIAFDKYNMANSQYEDTQKQVDDQHKLGTEEHDKALDRQQAAQEFAKTYGLNVQEFNQRKYEFGHMSAAQKDAHDLHVMDYNLTRQQDEMVNKLAIARIVMEKQAQANEEARAQRQFSFEEQRFKAEEDPKNPISPAYKQIDKVKTEAIKGLPKQLEGVAKDFSAQTGKIAEALKHDPRYYNPSTNKWTPAAQAEYSKRENEARQSAENSYDRIIHYAGVLGVPVATIQDFEAQQKDLGGKLKEMDQQTGLDSDEPKPNPGQGGKPTDPNGGITQGLPKNGPNEWGQIGNALHSLVGPAMKAAGAASLLGNPTSGLESMSTYGSDKTKPANQTSPAASNVPANAKSYEYSAQTTAGELYSNDGLHWYDQNGKYLGAKQAPK